MAIRPIRQFGDPVLRTVADPVTVFDDRLGELVIDLMDTLLRVAGRAGVAAPQIGVASRVFAYQADGRQGYVVNPVIEVEGPTRTEDEGCLSLPGLAFPTPRSARATVHGVDRHGRAVTVTGDGFLARALQHEYDHLDGRLYLDRLHPQARRQALRAIRQTGLAGAAG